WRNVHPRAPGLRDCRHGRRADGLGLMKALAVIILAAGQGTRMRSKVAKVLHLVGGRPMILYAIELAQSVTKGGKGNNIALVTGHQAEKIKDVIADYDVVPVVQTRRLGT